MSQIAAFFDLAPVGGGSGSGMALFVGAAIFFFIALVIVAVIGYIALRKTFKIGIRLLIAAIVVFVAAVGSIVILTIGLYSPPKPRPPRPIPTRTR